MSPRTRFTLILTCTAAALLALGGCGAGQEASKFQREAQTTSDAAPAAPPAGKVDGNAAESPSAVKRKIIFTGTVDVVVNELDAARAEVDRLLTRYDGYVAKSEVRNDTGTRRTATYTLRVPVDNFRPLVDALLGLGTPQRNAVDSQDVTEEWYDLDARLKTLRAEEEALNKLLKESGSRDEILKTREQITRLTEQIRVAQVRLNTLSKLSALSTVNLTLQEIRDYKPPTTPTFRDRVGRRFADSWESFVAFAQDVALLAVGLTPWLPVLLPLGLAGVYLVRKVRRAVNAMPDAARPHHPPYRAHPVGHAPQATTAHDAPADVQALEPPPPGDAPRPQ